MKRVIAMLIALAAPALAGTEYGKTTFYGDVGVGTYTNPTYLGSAWVANGVYSNAVAYTNVYRITGTNRLGRTPYGTNVTLTWTGSATTNGVTLYWKQAGGVSG